MGIVKKGLISLGVVCGLLLVGIALMLWQWWPFLSGKTNQDFSFALENDYRLVRVNASTCTILPPNGTWDDVPPNIVEANIIKSVVIGKAVKSVGSSGPSFEGYFVLDLSNGKSQYGLKRVAWEKLLEGKYQINDFTLLQPRQAYEKWKQSSKKLAK